MEAAIRFFALLRAIEFILKPRRPFWLLRPQASANNLPSKLSRNEEEI